MIELKNCSKEYSGSLALDSINLSFKDPGLVLLLGANAAGKSTLLKTIAGLLPVSQGEVCNPAPTAYFGHESGLYSELSVRENFMVLQSLQITDSKLLKDLIGIFDLSPLLSKRFSELSQGQKARVNLARVFASPESWPILLDEPAANLDSRWSSVLSGLIAESALKRLIMLVTHDPKKYYGTVSRVVFMDQGRIVNDFEAGQDSATKVDVLYSEYLR